MAQIGAKGRKCHGISPLSTQVPIVQGLSNFAVPLWPRIKSNSSKWFQIASLSAV